MSVKLTDKEINALAKKLQEKQKAIDRIKLDEAAKKKLPEAKLLMKKLWELPDSFFTYLYNNRYRQGSLSISELAKVLVEKDENTYIKDSESYSADVVLAANGCNTMAQLCTKLGI